MENDWDNETLTTLSIITPPTMYLPQKGPTIFLAGSIGETTWRKNTISYIENKWLDKDGVSEITLFDPTRIEGWDDNMEIEQNAWSISLLNTADYIIMHLTASNSESPISLLEAGLYMKEPRFFLVVDKSYPRENTILTNYAHYGYNKICSTIEEAVDNILTQTITCE